MKRTSGDLQRQQEYLDSLITEIKQLCNEQGVKMKDYFHHEKIRKS